MSKQQVLTAKQYREMTGAPMPMDMREKVKKRQASPEYEVYVAIAAHMRQNYPNVIWRFDQAGLNLSKTQAGKQKVIQNGDSYPDFFIAKPKHGLSGCFIEAKAEGTRLFKMDGSWASDHIAAQNECLEKLQKQGYFATFGVGIKQCLEIIESYLTDSPG